MISASRRSVSCFLIGRKKRPRWAPLQFRTSGMSFVSILPSGNAARASSSARCAAVRRLEILLFIIPPFMAGRLAGADYSAGPLIGSGVDFRPCVNDEHDHRTDDPNGLPTFFTRVHV